MDMHDVEPTARWVPYYSPVAPIEHDSDHAHDMYATIPVAAFEVPAPAVREDLITAAGEHIGRIIRDLYDGVAFWDKRQSMGLAYHVFSHEGDELGSYTAADVQYAVNFMKRRGVEVGKLKDDNAGPAHPSLTFAWKGWFTWNNPLRV